MGEHVAEENANKISMEKLEGKETTMRI